MALTPDSRPPEESERDIAAARAEFKGRRDQLAAEYDERLQQLDQLAHELRSGGLGAKAVSDRVRQLVGKRGGARPTRAGRTQIGVHLPANAPPTPAPTRMGPSGPSVASALAKVSAAVDGRLAHLLVGEPTREELRLELALAGRLRRSLDRALADLPADVVLLASLGDYTGDAQAILDDLVTGGARRAERLIAFARERVGELSAAGGETADLKAQLKRAKEQLAQGDAPGGTALAFKAWTRAHAELERRLPTDKPSLLDDLLRRA